MNETGLTEEEVLVLLNNAKDKDLKYDRVLSSMCTYPHKIAAKAHMQFMESNMGDFGLFQGTYSMEQEIIRSLGNILHCSSINGYLTTGGTESNIQAIRSMRNSHRIKVPNIVVPESAHFSFDKIADVLNIEVRKANLDEELKVSMESLESLIDQNTVGLVAIAGSTEFGQVDPIAEISKLAVEKNLFLHVDAAFGGFVLPFLPENNEFDFSLPGVTSIAIDPHKMGLSTIPSGVLLFRNVEDLTHLKAETPYLTIDTQYTLTGTRSGAAVAATYAVMQHLGREGYRQVVSRCMELTDHLVKSVKEIGIDPVIDPVMNVVALDVPHPAQLRSKLAKEYKWQVSITQKPAALRLVIMPHMDFETIDMFVADLQKAVLELQ
ncbi:tyrosine decarboxylase MfnA [Methanolobus sp. ZRKC3]|uniref:tyrosine decarboxylase MfnA n=1 Tax=Methanolobus sp. ZRKC3 TaxID=3125786 RepID=UPI00325175FB